MSLLCCWSGACLLQQQKLRPLQSMSWFGSQSQLSVIEHWRRQSELEHMSNNDDVNKGDDLHLCAVFFLHFDFFFLSYLNAGAVMSCGECLLLLSDGCQLDYFFCWHVMDKKRTKILTKSYAWFEFKPKYEDQCCHTMMFFHIACLKKSDTLGDCWMKGQ